VKIRSSFLIVLVVAASAGCLFADVKLPAIISDHMVLEKTAKVPIWGKADPGEEVSVTLDGQTVKTTAGADGKWMISLNLKDSAPGPFEMTVEGKNKLKLVDVLVGEVWVAAGQSNMEWILAATLGATGEIAGSTNPMLRQFKVQKAPSSVPAEDCIGSWVSAGPQTSGGFTAVGYYFGKALQKELNVPVGLINDNYGGTHSEAWTGSEALDTVPHLKAARERLQTALSAYPEQKKAFVESMGAWIRENGREDKPVADPSVYAGMDVSSEGWTPVKIPGSVAAPGLPDAGAVWIRKEVDVSAKGMDCLTLFLPIDGFDSVYWNGKLLKQTTYRDFPGKGHMRCYGPYTIPGSALNQGKNILAIRLYEPVAPAVFTGSPRADMKLLDGEWLARAEYAFPPIDAGKTALAPQPPQNPPEGQNVPSFLFNGMIHPILPYAITGVVWYQGESNAGRAWQYRSAFPLLIEDWRKQWGQGPFPFYFCQLANYMDKKAEPGESAWAELREAQSMSLSVPNTGQAVLIDLGESGFIHPRNKADVGERLAKIALAGTYGKPVPFSGPVYQSMEIADGKALLKFAHTDGGLVAKPLPDSYVVRSDTNTSAPLVRHSPQSGVEGFAICGSDHKWVWADAKIDGDKVIVWSEKVPAPVAVRYAWADNPTCNLYNGAGFPASPFRTDDFPPVTLNGKL